MAITFGLWAKGKQHNGFVSQTKKTKSDEKIMAFTTSHTSILCQDPRQDFAVGQQG